ncbi:acyltransferase family protein [Kineococcus indalonis]|uniref:acyltransferase family protein n=1 Tax=Kineococcus indalonis TaxID=2696566 RepID=UPI001411E73F|nr:acyltransferase [Kineococcus indalonis]NAZ85058.1 acyltransferase family protein [Kineococcus indalonis]
MNGAAAVPRAAPAGGGRRPGLDVLRGFAVLLVLLRHAAPETFGGAGIVGVVVFFCLSGYLITGILVREVRTTGHLALRRFYRNRALRLLPALALVVTAFAVVEVATDVLGDRAVVLPTVLLAVTYTSDLSLVLGVPISEGLGHLWTLAVEEQFYLVWPLLVLAAARRGRTGLVVGALACVALVVQWATVAVAHRDASVLYTLPTSWAVTLLVGAATALHGERLARVLRTPAGAVLPVLSAALLLGACLVPDAKALAATYVVGAPAVALCTSVLVVALQEAPAAPLRWAEPLRLLGLISYGAYLWNFLVVGWLAAVVGTGAAVGVAGIAATVALAVVSWFALERPVLRWKERLDGGRGSRPGLPAPRAAVRAAARGGGARDVRDGDAPAREGREPVG